MRAALAAAIVLILSGCTHVATMRSQDIAAPKSNEALIGTSYSLPMIQYEIKLSRLLDFCDGDAPEFAIHAQAVEQYVAGESFELDPTSLSSVMKTSAMGLETHDDLNTLKSFNAHADDQTGPVLATVARTGIAVAAAFSGVPAASPMSASGERSAVITALTKSDLPKPLVMLSCSTIGRERLQSVKRLTGEFEQHSEALSTLTADVERLKEVAQFDRFSEASMERLVGLLGDQHDLEAAIAKTEKKLRAHQRALRVDEKTFLWPTATNRAPDPEEVRHPYAYSSDAGKLRNFCSNFVVAVFTDQGSLRLNPAEIAPKDELELNLHCQLVAELFAKSTETELVLVRESVLTRSAAPDALSIAANLERDAPAKGILFREPARGWLEVQHKRVRPDDQCLVEERGCEERWVTVFKDEPQWVPQLGDLRFLPFKSGPFENEALSLILRKDGRLERLSYETKEAALARATSAAADAAEKYRADQLAREQLRRADEKYYRELAAAQRADELARKQYQLDMLTKSKALLDAQDGESVARAAALAALNAEIVTLTAQIARLKLGNEWAALQPTATP